MKVSVSAEARRLAETHHTERHEKIAKLRDAVESGQLPIDARAIAQKIVDGA